MGFSAIISRTRGVQWSFSFFITSSTITGFEVAPVPPRSTAYASSATAQESFQKSVGVDSTIRRSGLSTVAMAVMDPPSAVADRHRVGRPVVQNKIIDHRWLQCKDGAAADRGRVAGRRHRAASAPAFGAAGLQFMSQAWSGSRVKNQARLGPAITLR